MGFKEIRHILKGVCRSSRYSPEPVERLRDLLVFLLDSESVKECETRIYNDYLATSILVSDCFDLDFDVHGIMMDCRVFYSLAAFKSSTFTPSDEVEEYPAVAISDRVDPYDLAGAIDIDLGQLYRDDSTQIVWTGRSSKQRVLLPNGTTVFFDGASKIVGVSSPYANVD